MKNLKKTKCEYNNEEEDNSPFILSDRIYISALNDIFLKMIDFQK